MSESQSENHLESERFLFVYGTLRRTSSHRMARYLANSAEWLGEVTVRGELFNLGSYPGLVIPGSTAVAGDLYRLPAAAAQEITERLDEYEGCSRLDPQPHQYRKTTVTAETADGDEYLVTTYVLDRMEDVRERIPGGDYLAWLAGGNGE